MLETDSRLALLQDWLSRDLGLHPQRIEPASSDASSGATFARSATAALSS